MGQVPNKLKSSVTVWEVKLGPLFKSSTRGLPCWEKSNFNRKAATFLAVAEAAKKASTHLVKWSTAMSMYWCFQLSRERAKHVNDHHMEQQVRRGNVMFKFEIPDGVTLTDKAVLYSMLD